MDQNQRRQLAGFYENELTNRFLAYWLPRCVDEEHGGFVNCFDNRGEHLVSRDKYCWSQGRFVWVFAKLSMLEAPIFSQSQRQEFLRLAKHGADFLMEHCLMGKDDWRCVFLLDGAGRPKQVEGYDRLDTSIYADCFVVSGLARYASASGEEASYRFAKRLYLSVVERIHGGDFQTLPYPLSKAWRAHGIPMILANVARDVYLTAEKLDKSFCAEVLAEIERCTADILEHFVDENDLLHEVITADNAFFPKVLGQHINPGHMLEDAWFLLDSIRLLGRKEWKDKVYRMALKALETGWDQEYGGLLHFAGLHGGRPDGDASGIEQEAMYRQLSGWGDKLWWVHSEALYSTLRCHQETGDPRFLAWHEKVFDYVYRTFPNRDPEVREWMQIQSREGTPMDAVVALPVKDPYHVLRNLALIVELLHMPAAQ